jgi:hypothetical protein
MWDKIREEVADLLKGGLIEQIVDSEYISPVFMVKKPNSSDLRFCIDYKGVNKLLSVKSYLLPNITDILDGCAGEKYFARFDLSKGFWQLNLEEDSRDLSAFRVGNNIYRWTRVPKGITPAPFYLQRSMHTIFADLLGQGVFIYLDDILIKADSEEEFLDLLRKVLQRFRDANLRCKATKCLVVANEIPILGHILSGTGVRMSRNRIHEVLNIPHPSTTKELRRVLGVTNYMRRFIPNYANIAAPLTALVNGTKKDLTSPEARAAFKDLLVSVDNQLHIHHLRYDIPIVVTTDASLIGLGGIISNIYDDGSEHVVGCISHKFTPAEANWKTIEQEAFAIVYCLQPSCWRTCFYHPHRRRI